jgi:hypothetical protein
VSGEATVRLADGRVYVGGRVELDTGAVTVIDCRLRVRNLTGERLYPAKTFTVPIAAVERIEWLAPAQAACAELRAAA